MSARASSIGEDIQQRRPFRSRGQEALVSLLRTADVVRARMQSVIEPHGITLQQYNVLRILRGAGAQGLPTLAIAERMIERVPGITRLLDRLERKGLVTRLRCTIDRRQVLCTITAAGLKLLGGLDQPVATHDEGALDSLSAAEQKAFLEALDRIRAAASSRRPGTTRTTPIVAPISRSTTRPNRNRRIR